jgi:prohibitin 2
LGVCHLKKAFFEKSIATWILSFSFCVLQGEAKSAQLIGEAISNNPAFITLRKIEASREIANTISTSQNRVFLSADSLLLNLQDLGVEEVALKAPLQAKK